MGNAFAYALSIESSWAKWPEWDYLLPAYLQKNKADICVLPNDDAKNRKIQVLHFLWKEMTGWNGLRHGCSYEAFILFCMMKKGKLWMRVGNSFQGTFMWNLIDLNLINLNEFQFSLFQDHNPLTTKSRPDVHFRRLEFLFLLINALQLLLLKPGVLLVFSRQSSNMEERYGSFLALVLWICCIYRVLALHILNFYEHPSNPSYLAFKR